MRRVPDRRHVARIVILEQMVGMPISFTGTKLAANDSERRFEGPYCSQKGRAAIQFSPRFGFRRPVIQIALPKHDAIHFYASLGTGAVKPLIIQRHIRRHI